MRKMVCDCCGGQVSDSGRCLYCGTLYEVTPPWFEIERHVIIERPEIRTVCAQTTITNDMLKYMDYETCMDYTKKQLCSNIASFILENNMLDIISEDNHFDMSTKYKAIVKVVIPRRWENE